MQKWYEFGFRRRYFQVNTRRCLFLLAKILFANTEKNRVPAYRAPA